MGVMYKCILLFITWLFKSSQFRFMYFFLISFFDCYIRRRAIPSIYWFFITVTIINIITIIIINIIIKFFLN